MRVWKQQLEPGMEQLSGSNWESKTRLCIINSVQSASCKMLGWKNHKLESTLPGEISTSDMHIIPL